MSLLIEDESTVSAIQDLARQVGRSPEDVVRDAVAVAIERQREVAERRARLAALQDRVASWPDSGLKADKAFFDDLGGGL